MKIAKISFHKLSYYLLSVVSIIQVAKATLSERNNSEFIDINAWSFQELLINYQGGFVRRGFIGNLIYLIDDDGILFDTLYVFVFVNFLIFIFLINLNLELSSLSNAQKLLFHISIFAPFSITLFGNYYARKEMFILNLYLIVLLINRSGKKNLLIFSIFITGALSLLIHEGITFFLLFPFLIHIFNTAEIEKRVQAVFKTFMVLIFGIIIVFKGNNQIVNDIIQSLSSQDLALISTSNYDQTAIDAIGWGVLDTLRTTYVLIFSGSLVYWSVFFVIFAYTISVIFKKNIKSTYLEIKKLFSNNPEFFLILPLFIIGFDWGRWIFTLFYLYFFLLITKSNYLIEKITFNLNILIFFIISFLTEMPACCIQMGGTAVTSNYFRIYKSFEITIMNFLN